MTTRTLTFTGMKVGADPTVISATFDGVNIFSGAIANMELGTLFTHDIEVNDIPDADVPNPLSNDSIPFMTSSLVNIDFRKLVFYPVNVYFWH